MNDRWRKKWRAEVGAVGLGNLFLAACLVAGGCENTPRDLSDAEAVASARFERVRNDPELLREFLSRMPLGADLHHHVGGAAPPGMLIDFAAESRLCLPDDPAAVWRLHTPPCDVGLREVADALRDPELRAEIERRWSMLDYESDDPKIVRTEANAHFFGIFGQIRLASRDLGRLLASVRSLAAAQGISYLETSSGWSPDRSAVRALHDVSWNDDFLKLRRQLLVDPGFLAVRDAIVAGLPTQLSRSDELLGCGRPDEDPGCGVEVRFLRIAARDQPPSTVFVQALLAYEVARASSLAVGVNLVAPETGEYSLRDYALHMRIFGKLAAFYPEVRTSLHAAEMTDAQAVALGARDHLALAIGPIDAGGAGASRIGHGVALDAERSREEVLERMRSQRIAVEINLRSNALLLGVTGEAHPLTDYLAAGVPIVLSTDDPGLMGTDLREQFALAAGYEQIGYLDLKTFVRNSVEYSFLPGTDRARLAAKLEQDLDAFELALTVGSQTQGIELATEGQGGG